jgi:hypothetical protein
MPAWEAKVLSSTPWILIPIVYATTLSAWLIVRGFPPNVALIPAIVTIAMMKALP